MFSNQEVGAKRHAAGYRPPPPALPRPVPPRPATRHSPYLRRSDSKFYLVVWNVQSPYVTRLIIFMNTANFTQKICVYFLVYCLLFSFCFSIFNYCDSFGDGVILHLVCCGLLVRSCYGMKGGCGADARVQCEGRPANPTKAHLENQLHSLLGVP